MNGLRHNLLQRAHPYRGLGIGLLILCGLWSSWLLQQYQRQADRITGAEYRRDHLLSRQTLALQRTRLVTAPAHGAVTEELNYAWGPVVQALETPTGNAVRLLAADPDPRTRHLTLNGEADSLQDALDYLGALQQRPGLHNVHLGQHQFDASTGSVTFTAQAAWRQP